MANAHLRPPFRCPLCDHDDYATVTVNNRPTEASQCLNCSVVFKDADRFTKHRKPMPKAAERVSPPIEGAYIWPAGSGRKRR